MKSANKPIDSKDVLSFANSDNKSEPTVSTPQKEKKAKKATQAVSRKKGLTPLPIEGDVKLSCNITAVLHHKLKIYSADTRISIRDILEHLIENLKDAKD